MSYFANIMKSHHNVKAAPTISLEETRKIFEDLLAQDKALEMVLKVLEVAKCKVCQSVVSPSAALCQVGHAVCKGCRGGSVMCPTCATPFSASKKSLILTKILSLLPRQCSYDGCPTIVQFGDDHLVWCGFKETTCKLCDWVGKRKELLSHVQDTHRSDVVYELEHDFKWRQFDPKSERREVTPVFVGNRFFWSIKTNDVEGQQLRNDYVLVPDGKTSTKVRVNLIVGDEEWSGFTETEKELSLVETENTISNSTENFEDFITDKSPFINVHWREIFFVCYSQNSNSMSEVESPETPKANSDIKHNPLTSFVPDVIATTNLLNVSITDSPVFGTTPQMTSKKPPPAPPPKPKTPQPPDQPPGQLWRNTLRKVPKPAQRFEKDLSSVEYHDEYQY